LCLTKSRPEHARRRRLRCRRAYGCVLIIAWRCGARNCGGRIGDVKKGIGREFSARRRLSLRCDAIVAWCRPRLPASPRLDVLPSSGARSVSADERTWSHPGPSAECGRSACSARSTRPTPAGHAARSMESPNPRHSRLAVSDEAFAVSVALRSAHRRLQTRSDIERRHHRQRARRSRRDHGRGTDTRHPVETISKLLDVQPPWVFGDIPVHDAARLKVEYDEQIEASKRGGDDDEEVAREHGTRMIL